MIGWRLALRAAAAQNARKTETKAHNFSLGRPRAERAPIKGGKRHRHRKRHQGHPRAPIPARVTHRPPTACVKP